MKTKRLIFKKAKTFFGMVLLTAIVFTSCTKNDTNGDDNDCDSLDNDCDGIIDNSDAFSALRENALADLTQTFQFNADDGSTTFTSDNGVQVTINGNCLTENGNAVTGQVDVEYVELFDKASMLVTNKPTMGTLPSGDKALLISGGEFLINATQNGIALDTTCEIQLIIPSALTGGPDNDMLLWRGSIDDEDNLTWDEVEDDDTTAQGRGVFAEGNNYYAFIGDFGWSNVDRFYNDPRAKTTILVAVPEGYDNTNSSVYLSYDGEDAGLANLDTYDADSGLFSEHYGQIPIGLECHVIFVTEEANDWKYAVQSTTIVENGVITITEGETTIATQTQLETIINNLP